MPSPIGPDKFIIYGLTDPDSLLIRYIGKSVSGLRRPKQHLSQTVKQKTYCANWLRSILARNQKPLIVVLEVTTMELLWEREVWWIAYGRALGWPLTNHTLGGEGTVGYRHRAETLEKLSLARKKALSTPEGREKHLLAHRTPEYRALASEIAKRARLLNPGLMVSGDHNIAKRPDIRKKIAESRLGKSRSEEVKAKLSRYYLEHGPSEKQLAYNKKRTEAAPCGTLSARHRAMRNRKLGLDHCGPCVKCLNSYNAYCRKLYARRKATIRQSPSNK